MLKWLQGNKKKATNKQKKKTPQTHPPAKQNAEPDQQNIIRTIAADHPEQTVQLIKHWLKD